MSSESRKLQWLLIIALIIFTFSSIQVAADETNTIENLGDFPRQNQAGHPRVESRLYHLMDDFGPEGKPQEGLRVIIEIEDATQQQLDTLTNQGVVIETSHGNLFQVLVRPGKLLQIADYEFVKYIRTPLVPLALESEGVGVMGADDLHSLSITGDGVKVAILDFGFIGYQDLLGTELPPSERVVTMSFNSADGLEGSYHGTACAEVVYDVAPGATLYLVSFRTGVEYLNAMSWLISQEVDVISLSIGWVNAGPYDGTGPICDAVNDARDNGILVSVSAGNQAQRHYQGTYTDTNANTWHEFSPEDEGLSFYAYKDQPIQVFLSWDASWPTSEDYDLYLYRNLGGSNYQYVTSSQTRQSIIPSDPTEAIGINAPFSGNYFLAVDDFDTTSPSDLEVFSFNHNFPYDYVPEGSLMIPADAAGAMAVGATYWGTDVIEPFSSQGPTNDGRLKPDVTAPDGITNSVYGYFSGTSASAPHVAGAAALLLQGYPVSPDTIQSALEDNAVDLGAAGDDNIYGSGRIDVLQAYFGLNTPPTISNPHPADLAIDVPISITSLSFTISDPDDDLLDYSVLTIPDIGTGGDTGVANGVYSIPISGLESNNLYTWQVTVDDGITPPTIKTYTYTTEESTSDFVLSLPFGDASVPVPDASGYGNDGALTGATWLSDNGGVYSFDGAGDYIAVADDSSLDVTDALAVSAWASKDGMSGTPSFRYIIGKGTRYTSEPYLLMYDIVNAEWVFKVYDGVVNYQVSASAGPGWHMVTGVFTGDGLALYVDGVLEDSAVFGATSLFADGGSVFIGGTNLGRYFDGLIDDVRVYSSALTDIEVGQIYSNTVNTYPSPSDLVLSLPFGDASVPVPDASGYGNDGALTGATWLSDNGGVYSFDGAGDYIAVADDSSLDVTDALAVSAWASKDGMSGTPSFRYIIGKGTRYTSEPYLLMYDIVNAEWVFKVYDGVVNYQVSASAGPGWHMVTGVFTGDGLALYVDGVLEDSAVFGATSLFADGGSVFIGGTNLGRYFDGLIDDVRVYSSALTDIEVGQIYSNTVNTYPSPSDLVLSLPFGDASVPVPDASGYGNDGALTGATWLSDNGGVYSFDGAGDYIAVADDSSLDVTDALAVSAWASKDGMSGTPSFRYIIGKGTRYTSEPYLLMYDIVNAEWVFKVYDGVVNYQVSASAGPGWHMVTGVFTGDGLALYVDGVLEDSAVFGATSLFADGGSVFIGGTNLGRYFDGLIDDVRVYSSALTDIEVGQIYSNTASNYTS